VIYGSGQPYKRPSSGQILIFSHSFIEKQPKDPAGGQILIFSHSFIEKQPKRSFLDLPNKQSYIYNGLIL
jgi:hypothetical protein